MEKLLAAFVILTLTSSTCNKSAQSKTCFKARLEIKGICMNYTFTLLEGDTSVVKVIPQWTNEDNNKTYKNAFALSSPCGFKDMKEGDTFYFVMGKNSNQDCMVCEAYYPTPPAKNNIKVVDTCP
jgi:hypothetical protein